jgi:IrrE N-terminal-like domain
MSRPSHATSYKVPYLRESVIEEHAQLVIDEWSEGHDAIVEPPVPIEEILEIGLGLDFEVCDLQAELGHADVLGGIWFGARTIKVDQSLDPSATSKMLGRYRFTLAHEIGHWCLHREHLMNDPAAASLFEQNSAPAFVCRSSEKPPEEWQADLFAACVLMPHKLIIEAWERWRGSPEEAVLTELGIKEDDEMAINSFCRPLADLFEVSAQAMRIRLQKLELLVKEREPKLF